MKKSHLISWLEGKIIDGNKVEYGYYKKQSLWSFDIGKLRQMLVIACKSND